ncbi:MAG: hypothetical protein V3W06_04360 [Acidimicrobiia bacterium]
MKTIYVVGKALSRTDPNHWELLGVYSSPRAAEKRCRDVSDFVLPHAIGFGPPDMSKAYFPIPVEAV